MKIRDFIQLEADIDVIDAYGLEVAFVGPQELTEAGYEYFKDVLEYEIEPSLLRAYIRYRGLSREEAQKCHKRAYEFFWSAAGYISTEDYDRWFAEDD